MVNLVFRRTAKHRRSELQITRTYLHSCSVFCFCLQSLNIAMKVSAFPTGLLRSFRPDCRRCCIGPLSQSRRERHQFQPQSVPRHFSISRPHAAIAAPEIDFTAQQHDGQALTARVVPASPSYFTGKPDFTDNLLHLQSLLLKYQLLPVLAPGHAPRVAWRTLPQYRIRIGEPIRASKYQKIIKLLHRLNHIHPSLMPAEVRDTLERYKRDVNPYANVAKPHTVDQDGRAIGVGRRKSATARVWLVEGDGEVLVNGKGLHTAFGRIHDRESAVWALKATQRIDKYNVWALVEGGGTTGQAEALTLGVAKALMVHEPLLKPALRRGEFDQYPPCSALLHRGMGRDDVQNWGLSCLATYGPWIAKRLCFKIQSDQCWRHADWLDR